MLSRSRVGLNTSLYSCLVVDNYPNGIGTGVVLDLFSSKSSCLRDSKQLCIIYFDMFSKSPQGLRVGVLSMVYNQASTIGFCSSLGSICIED